MSGWRFESWLVGGEPYQVFRVYKILDSIGRIKYIGCTANDLNSRLFAHISAAKNGFFKSVKEKKTTATIELIQEFDNPFEASELERTLVKNTKGLLNKANIPYIRHKFTYEYIWIKKRGGDALIEKFRQRAINRHHEWLKKIRYSVPH